MPNTAAVEQPTVHGKDLARHVWQGIVSVEGLAAVAHRLVDDVPDGGYSDEPGVKDQLNAVLEAMTDKLADLEDAAGQLQKELS